jgi:hypothetical protein
MTTVQNLFKLFHTYNITNKYFWDAAVQVNLGFTIISRVLG